MGAALYVNGMYRKTDFCSKVQFLQFQGGIRHEREPREKATSALLFIGLVSCLLQKLYCTNCTPGGDGAGISGVGIRPGN